MALLENYRTETIGRSDCRPIVRLSADTIVRWDYRPNPNKHMSIELEQKTNQMLTSTQNPTLNAEQNLIIKAPGLSHL